MAYSLHTEDTVLWASDIQNDHEATQQGAAVLIYGQGWGYRSGFYSQCWFVMDQLGRRLMVEKRALQFRWYDVFFYAADLSVMEYTLFHIADSVVDLEIQRCRPWTKGLELLGWTINRDTLQVKWVADWGPIAGFNVGKSLSCQVHPGHVIQVVNGHSQPDRIIRELEQADVLRIRVTKMHS